MEITITGNQLKKFAIASCLVLAFLLIVTPLIYGSSREGGDEHGFTVMIMLGSLAMYSYLYLIPLIGFSTDMYHWHMRSKSGDSFLEKIIGTSISLLIFSVCFVALFSYIFLFR